jgi:hypothetical protein
MIFAFDFSGFQPDACTLQGMRGRVRIQLAGMMLTGQPMSGQTECIKQIKSISSPNLHSCQALIKMR